MGTAFPLDDATIQRFIQRAGAASRAATSYAESVSETDLVTDVRWALADFMIESKVKSA